MSIMGGFCFVVIWFFSQESLLVVLRRPYGTQRIEPVLASILPTVLSITPAPYWGSESRLVKISWVQKGGRWGGTVVNRETRKIIQGSQNTLYIWQCQV